jgi:GntR family transcriptional regulator
MFFAIDPNNGVPIFDQVVRQVKYAIAEGSLIAGQLLPSVRQLSQQLALNPNTIARAYLRLQADGLLESLRGRGVVVTKGASKRCKSLRTELIAERIESVLSEALHAGLSSDEILQIVRSKLKAMDGQLPTVASQPEEK